MGRLLPLAFLILVVPTAIMLAVLTPPGQVADESAHGFRVEALAHGQLVGHRQPIVWTDGTTRIVAGVNTDVAAIHAAFPPLGGPVRGITAAELAQKRAVAWSGTRPFVEISPLAVYPPLFYAPAALGMAVAEAAGAGPFDAQIAARLMNVLAFATLGLLALLWTRRGQALLFCTLSVPMTVSLAASLSQDGLLIAAAVLGVALLTRPHRDQHPWRDAAFWAGIAVLGCVTLTKLPYAGLLALALLPLGGPGRPWAMRAAAVALAVLPALAWTAATMAFVAASSPRLPAPPGPLWPGDPTVLFTGPNAAAQLRVLWAAPLRLVQLPWDNIRHDPWLIKQGIGLLGWLDLILPQWLYRSWAAAIGCAAMADTIGTRRAALRIGPAGTALLALAAAAMVVAIYQSQYLTWTPVGAAAIEGPSGRYWLPLMPLLAAAIPRWPAAPLAMPLRTALSAAPAAMALASLITVPALIVLTYYVR